MNIDEYYNQIRTLSCIVETVEFPMTIWSKDNIVKLLEYIQENTEGFVGFKEIHFTVDNYPEITYVREFPKESN
jgi:pyruvate formate-lyase activating enzyme-like uncharacterized protein